MDFNKTKIIEFLQDNFENNFPDDFKKLIGFDKFKNDTLSGLRKNKNENDLLLLFTNLMKKNVIEMYCNNLKNKKIITAIKTQGDDCFNSLKSFLIKEERYEDVDYVIKIRNGDNL